MTIGRTIVSATGHRWRRLAKRVLRRQTQRQRTERRIERLRHSICDRLAADRADEARRTAATATDHRPDCLVTADLHVATAAHVGDDRHALELAIDTAHRRLAALPDAGEPPRLDPRQRVFCSGYFYSGSSAVVDFLHDHDGVVKWPPRGEMRLIKSPNGLADLAQRHADTGRLTAADLTGFYLHLVGQTLTLTPPGTHHPIEKVNANSRRLLAEPVAAGYLRHCLSGFLRLVEINGPQLSTAALETFCRQLVAGALDAAARDTGASVLVVDQAVTAWRLPLARFVPPSSFVVVHRDPRDNFAEARTVLRQPGRTEPTATGYVGSYRKKRAKAMAALPLLIERGHRTLTLGFEDFVIDHATSAERIRRFTGLDGHTHRPRRFRPERSRANIGKFRQHTSDEEIATITRELTEFLHPTV